jgi:Tol biopolymer transport system component
MRRATVEDSEFCFALNEASLREYVEPIYGWDPAVQREYHDAWFDPDRLTVILDGARSPNGKRLACNGQSPGPVHEGIFTVRSSDGRGLKLVTHKSGVPGDYSPDGKQIVFEGNLKDWSYGLFVVNLDGTDLHRIRPHGMLLNPDLTDGGSWSPDGTQIVTWAQSAPENKFSIWIVNADGSGVHQVPIGCGGAFADPTASGCRRPMWSPDGTKIVFEYSAPQMSQSDDIYLVNPDGSGLEPVTRSGLDEGQPNWGTHPFAP